MPEAKVALHVEGQLIPAGVLVTAPTPLPGRVTVNIGGPLCTKEAETEALLFKVTMQAPVPLHAPPHPAKLEPEPGVGVNVTWVPTGKFAPQVLPQLIPAGVLVTTPVPVPESVTVSVGNAVIVKAAETDRLLFTVTLQAPVPLHAPPQPAKVEPEPGLAVNVTGVPMGKLAPQVVPQLIPAGVLVTVPTPVPGRVTVNIGDALCTKEAETDVLLFTVTLQVTARPLQAPPQPAKRELAAGTAVRVTCEPWLNVALHVGWHEMLLGVLLTDPAPFPAVATLS